MNVHIPSQFSHNFILVYVFQARKTFSSNGKTYNYYSLKALEDAGVGNVSKLPYSICRITRDGLNGTSISFNSAVPHLAKFSTCSFVMTRHKTFSKQEKHFLQMGKHTTTIH
jgi:aconitase A